MKRINVDFQGFEVNKITLRELLLKLGADYLDIDDVGTKVLAFDADDPCLDLYPNTIEDDGMGYGVNERVITEDVDCNPEKGYINLFVDRENNDEN